MFMVFTFGIITIKNLDKKVLYKFLDKYFFYKFLFTITIRMQ